MAAPLANGRHVAEAVGREITAQEALRVTSLLAEASDLAETWMRCVPDPVPDAVVRVVARMVARVLDSAQPVGQTQAQYSQTAGQMAVSASHTYSADSVTGGPWLTRADKLVLRRHGCGGRVVNMGTA